jgi:uncharacterized protein YqeY
LGPESGSGWSLQARGAARLPAGVPAGTLPRTPGKALLRYPVCYIECRDADFFPHRFIRILNRESREPLFAHTTMALIERIQKDLTTAMMAKDELRLSVLRMVKSALKYKEVEKVRPLEDAEALQVLQTLMKQRRESVEQFTKGGRQDLADKETQEIAILEAYMPAGASDADMSAAIEAAIVETGATSPKSMGAVIKAAKAKLEGKTVDGKALSDRVRDRLSKMG